MKLTPSVILAPNGVQTDSIKTYLERVTDDLLASLPAAEQLSASAGGGSSPATAPCWKAISSTG